MRGGANPSGAPPSLAFGKPESSLSKTEKESNNEINPSWPP